MAHAIYEDINHRCFPGKEVNADTIYLAAVVYRLESLYIIDHSDEAPSPPVVASS